MMNRNDVRKGMIGNQEMITMIGEDEWINGNNEERDAWKRMIGNNTMKD